MFFIKHTQNLPPLRSFFIGTMFPQLRIENLKLATFQFFNNPTEREAHAPRAPQFRMHHRHHWLSRSFHLLHFTKANDVRSPK